MSRVTDLDKYFKDLALDMFAEIPYYQSAADFIEENYKDKSWVYKQKLLNEFEAFFVIPHK